MDIKKRTTFIILFLLIFCTINATDYYVDASTGNNTTGDGSSGYPWLTITYALSQVSGSGHIIHVAEGYYDSSLGESFPIYVKNGVSMDGAGDSLTVIDAGYVDGTSVLYCIGITDASTYIEGFSITGGYYYDSWTEAAGVYISAGSTLTLENNFIYDNYLGTWGTGGGIYIINSSPRILNNIIASNGSDYWGDGDAIAIDNSSPLITGNTIIYNISEMSYSCIYITGTSSAPRFVNNVIAANSGTGIYCIDGIPTVINNTISDNGDDGIYISGCYPDSIVNNIISFNSGYGIYESGTASDPGIASYNLFYANSSGLYYNEGSTAYYSAELLNNDVAECENNIDPDPVFEDRYNWDYHLHLYSPAIDAGHPSFPYSNEPLPNGGRINLGAYGNTAEATTSETPPVLPADLYVDATSGSDDTGDGSSGNPWQTITYALSQIYTTGHTIHVASGTYNAALGESFPIIIKNGVSLSGEDNVSTIIDAEGNSSNYLQVVNCIGITDASTFIEGFTITGGYLSSSSQGGGIYIGAGSALTLRNNIISDNYVGSSGYGGAIFISNSSPIIINNNISGNTAYYGYGNAMAIYNSSPQIKYNTIINNTGSGSYNCVYIYGSSSSPVIIGNVIAKNSGGGISCYDGARSIINNTISDNTGDGIYISYATVDSIVNNTITYNSRYGICESGSTSDPGIVSYNLFYSNMAGLYFDEGTVYFTSGTLNGDVPECKNNIEGDPLFIDKAGNDFHEYPYSAAIDAGDPSLPYINEPEDNGDRINIGAYGNTGQAAIYAEPPVVPADLYVDAVTGNDGTGDGSLGNPWQTITYALSQIYTAGHTVHVAAGNYNSTLGEIFPINLKNGISLSGSDAASTVIDAGSSTNRVFNCIGITDASTCIEGLTIYGGYLSSSSYGGGIYISAGSALTISKNIIDNNYIGSSGLGGGIYINNSSPLIINNKISNNTSYYGYGGALSIDNSSPVIRGNTILNNTGTGAYNAVYISGSSSSPLLVRNLIAKNTGDGISCSSSSPTILNNTISDNTGDGIYLGSATPDSINNNILSYNSGYGIYESSSSYDPGKVWYNLYYANSTGLYYDEGSTDYYTASSLNSGVAECANNIDGDPAFTDRANNDYHIQSASSAVDMGDPNSPLDPDGSRADIGAYYFIMPPPDAPVATGATFVGQTDFIINWNSAVLATGYLLDISTDNTFSTFIAGFESRDVVNMLSYSVTGLTASSVYYYRVRAYNEGGTSPSSNVISIVTLASLPAPPSAPVVYAGTDITQTSFIAAWEPTDAATSYRIDVAVEIDPVNYVSGYYDLEVLNATEYLVTGLTANTDYYYWVRACNSGGASANSDTVVVTTLPYPPLAPWSNAATDITQTSYTANWESASTATGYYLDVATDIDFTSFVAGYNNLDVNDVTSYSVTGLSSNSYYYYRISAYNTGGTGPYSGLIQAVTLHDPPPAPTCNDASDLTQTSFTANWNSSPGATGYFLDVCFTSDFTSCATYYQDVGNVTGYNITGLTSNTAYYYRVTAYNSGGTSGYSDTIIVTTLPDPPPAPVAYDATDVLQESFTANWESTATATGYLIEVATDIDFTEFVGEYYGMDVYNVLSYSVTGLSPNTTYYYRITSYNSGGTSDNSETITVTTLPWAPPVPYPYEATSITTTSFTANWETTDGAIGYALHIATDEAFTQFVTGYQNLDVFNVTSYEVTGLDPNTTYYYCVSAYNEGGESSNSGGIQVTTLLEMPDLPDAPTADPATNITQTKFQANWTPASGTDGFYLDVAYDDVFSSYVTGYNNLDVGYDISLDIGGLSSNTVYYYRVRGHNVSGTGDNSNVVSVTTLPDPPPAPTGLSASSCNNEVYLQWDQTTEAGFMQYNVYWGTAPAPSSLYASYNNPSWNAITISDLVNGQTYYFRVTTVISPGVESDYSTTTSVKVKTGVIPRIKSKWGKVLICYNPNDSLTSFQWFVGTSLITGATAQYHVTTGQSGYYYVVASDHDGCYNHSNLVYISGSKSISVYPNPAKSNFTLNLSSDFMGETVVTIYNSTGIKSMEYRTEKRDIDLNCEIPVGNLKDGIYTIEVNVNDEEIEYTKLIIIE